MTKILTVLQALEDGRVVLMTKTIIRNDEGQLVVKSTKLRADGAPWSPYFNRPREWEFATFDQLCQGLNFAYEAGAYLVHGQLTDTARKAAEIRRLHKDDVKRKDDATLIERPCPYILIDIDELQFAEDIVIQQDPQRALEFILTALPEELAGVSCWYQFSSSAGIKKGAKIHLVFMLSVPTEVARLKRWAESVNEKAGFKLFDLAPYIPGSPENPKIFR
jgi:hypothetical protein